MIQTETEVRRSGILAWFSQNPWIGVLASVCSIVGVPLGFYFYFGAQASRELTFAVNPIKTTVVNAGGTSAIRVFHGDQEITSDVIAEQVAIWNAGKLPIRPENVLEPVTLSLKPAAQILEVTVRKPARNAVGFSINGAEMRAGKIGLTWRILEQNDGAVIQVLHTGRPGTKIALTFVVEGQRRIGHASPTRIDTWPLHRFVFVAAWVVGTVIAVILIRLSKRYQIVNRALTLVFLLAFLIVLAGWWWELTLRTLGPPVVPFEF